MLWHINYHMNISCLDTATGAIGGQYIIRNPSYSYKTGRYKSHKLKVALYSIILINSIFKCKKCKYLSLNLY